MARLVGFVGLTLGYWLALGGRSFLLPWALLVAQVGLGFKVDKLRY